MLPRPDGLPPFVNHALGVTPLPPVAILLSLVATLLSFPAAAATDGRDDTRPPGGPASPQITGPMGATALSASWEVPVSDTSSLFVVGTRTGFAIVTRSGRVAHHLPGVAEPAWQIDLAGRVEIAPVSSGDRLAVVATGEAGPALALIDTEDGRVIVRHPAAVPAHLSSLPGGIAVAEAPAGAPAALAWIDPDDGAIRWRAVLPAPPSTPASQCGDALLVGGRDGSVLSLKIEDGSTSWTLPLGQAITTSPLCLGRWVYVGSADNRLHALKITSRGCRHRWSYLTGGDIGGRLFESRDRVLFFSYDTYVYGVKADNGHLVWKTRLGRRPPLDAALVSDLLMVAPLNSERLEVFRARDGAQVAILTLPSANERFVTPPVRTGRMIVLAAARYGEEVSRVLGIDTLFPAAESGPPSR